MIMGTGQLCESFARLPRPHDCYDCFLKAFNENTETQLQAQDNAERILFAVYRNYIELYRKTPEERYKEIICRCPEILQILTLK